MSIKFALTPIPLIAGGWMFVSSFATTTVQQSVTPYSTQQQTVVVEMPEPAKSMLRWGGTGIMVMGTSGLVFWGMLDKRRSVAQKNQKLYLRAREHGQQQPLWTAEVQTKRQVQGQPHISSSPPTSVNSAVSNGMDVHCKNTSPTDFVPSAENNSQVVYHQPQELADSNSNLHESEPDAERNLTPEVGSYWSGNGSFLSVNSSSQLQVPREESQSFLCNLNHDKYQDVRSLVHENAVCIVGKEKGSGKTSKLGYLVGEHIKLGHLVWRVDPFAKGVEWKGIKVFGRKRNYVEATNAIREFNRIAFQRIEDAGDEIKEYDPFEDIHIHLSLDEVSNYENEINKVDATVMSQFWEVVVQVLRQANMSVAFASHGDTQALLGGCEALKGKSNTIKDAIVWLYAMAVTDPNVDGNKRCAGWAYLVRPDGGERQRQRIEIPNWMQGPSPTRSDSKDKYNYIELVKQYCPQFLYLPKPESGFSTPQAYPGESPEEFQRRLSQNEKDFWAD